MLSRILTKSGRIAGAEILGLRRPLIALALCGGTAFGQSINMANWGTVTTPVYNQAESNPFYSNAEILAGPNKFGSYYAGVLPNGRKVTPAGTSIQIGMNPLGVALTPDGKYVVTSNDDEREGTYVSYQSPINLGGYSLTVIDPVTFTVVSQIQTSAKFFIGLQISGPAGGPYNVWAAGGPSNDVRLFSLSSSGVLTPGTPADIVISPTLPGNAGYVSNYIPGAPLTSSTEVPTGYSNGGAHTTFPAGIQLSPDGNYLYVACNGDQSVAIIDTHTKGVLKQLPAGAFPYGIAVNAAGDRIAVSNWGIEQYKFANPTYDPNTGQLTALGTTGANTPDGFYVPPVTKGKFPLTSSVHIYAAKGGFASLAVPKYGKYLGTPLTLFGNNSIGDTHPSAMAVVKGNGTEVLYVAKSNDDALTRIVMSSGKLVAPDYNLGATFVAFLNNVGSKLTLAKGAYPNAMVVSPDNTRLYVAEAGINSVAVLDVTDPLNPNVLGRIPTGWYPTALAISPDGNTLYIANAKGVGEDINPAIVTDGSNGQVPPPTGLGSDSRVDSNFIFGSLQQVNLTTNPWDYTTVQANNFTMQPSADTSVVPAGGTSGSARIKTVIFIEHENKTFDSMLGNLGAANSGPFGNFGGTAFNNIDGSTYANGQYTGVSFNTQALATAFATGVNYYSESEESDAGHQFCASGTASDYTEKTLLVKSGRGLLVNKNFEPEDYPEGGYIFNNLARWNKSFKDYGELIRIDGTDTGAGVPTTNNDPLSGNLGYPQVLPDGFTLTNHPVINAGDVSTQTQGLGQSYFLKLPILGILGTNNKNGTPRLDLNYPGYNFNISDQRRALEFISDFDAMVNAGTLPQFLYIYQPNDHTGSVQAPNASSVIQTICPQYGGNCSPLNQIGDSDVGLGMVVQHIMNSPVYYNSTTNTGAAIFMTYDDAQSSLDHIHPHRTPLLVISPFAKPGYLATRHYSTASIVKTEELLMGMPANNFGDLFATDLRDMFQSTYNGITAGQINFNLDPNITPSKEGKKIWALVDKLDTSAPDRDSRRLGVLIRLSIKADELHDQATKSQTLESAAYQKQQKELYEQAVKLVSSAAPADNDD